MRVFLVLNLLNELDKMIYFASLGEHNIVLSNEFNKFNTKDTQIQYPFYHINSRKAGLWKIVVFMQFRSAIYFAPNGNVVYETSST